MYTYTSLLAISGSELRFRENGLLIVTDSDPGTQFINSSSPAHTSLFQSFYGLYPETSDASMSGLDDTSTSEKQTLQEVVMKALSDRMRDHHQKMQHLLVVDLQRISALHAQHYGY